MNKQELAAKIWASANQMRSKIEANEYKDYILGFIFYKYLCDKLEQFAQSQDFTAEDIQALAEDDPETVGYLQANLGYFIAYEHLFSTWLKQGSDFSVASVHDALSAFSRLISPQHSALFDGIFNTLQSGLSKLGNSTGEQSKAISALIQLIKDIPTDGRQGYDILGFIYEYLISMFAANAGKKAGEFYTPHEVSLLMSEIIAQHLKGRSTIDIYDPTSGSGSLLLNIGQAIAQHMGNPNNIKYFAQELKENTYNLTRMNLVMRGIHPSNILTRNADTLEHDWPYFDDRDPINTYNPLYLDAVVSNPPYSQKWDPSHKDNDPRYARFGLAPQSKADYAFLLHDLYHLKPDGIMAIVLPHGVLFRGGEEGQIRKNLIENNHIDTIIGLPANIFFGTGIPTIIIVLRQKRSHNDVLFIDAAKGFAKEGKNNKLRACDIKKIADTVAARSTQAGYSQVVSKQDIRANDYNLNIPRYVDSSEPPETWDLYAAMFGGIPNSELDPLAPYWQAFAGLRPSLFTDDGTPYAQPQVEHFASAIAQHPSVNHYLSHFAQQFANLAQELKTQLIDPAQTLAIHQQLEHLAQNIFQRLATVPLVDKYQAYQLLAEQWANTIAPDLETLQNEGPQALTQIDPLMVSKKVRGQDALVQEGWQGRILPFSLVQSQHLQTQLQHITRQQQRLEEIQALSADLLEQLDEDDKDSLASSGLLNDDGDKWQQTPLSKEAKTRHSQHKQNPYPQDSLEAKIIQAAAWGEEEKTLKKTIKDQSEQLQTLSKTTLENLSHPQALELLQTKWITPLIDSLHQLAQQPIATLGQQLQTLADKYRTTYAANAQAIAQTGQELATMLGELEGNEHDMQGLAQWQTLLQTKAQP